MNGRSLHWLLILARVALGWERLWPSFWGVLGVLAAFLTAALLNLLPLLPGWAHLAALLGFGGGLIFAIGRVATTWRFPTRAEARRRLERDSALEHRPLQTQVDRLPEESEGDSMARALWLLHQWRMAARVAGVRVRFASAALSDRRAAAWGGGFVAALLMAGAASWGEWGARLEMAATPAIEPLFAIPDARLDLWVTPPEYTGAPPMLLRPPGSATAEPPLRIPSGSVVLARVSGGRDVPVLLTDGRSTAFSRVEEGSHQVSERIERGKELAVVQDGRDLGRWSIEVFADQPPSVSFATAPSFSERQALRIEYQASDDYGLTGVSAQLWLDRRPPEAAKAADSVGAEKPPVDAPVLPMTLPGAHPKQARAAAFHDLTEHPWAGLRVLLRLSARDDPGQEGMSPTVALTLPERVFSHPAARAVIEQRKRLAVNGEGARIDAARALSALSARPEAFGDDAVTFLILRSAIARLMVDRAAGAIASVQSVLWDTALRIEGGEASLAERELREAARALSEALARNASEAETQRLMEEFQAAMDRWLNTMDAQLRQSLAKGQLLPPSEDADEKSVSREELEAMVERMRELSAAGAHDAARQMLSDLQSLLENLQTGAQGEMGGGKQSDAAQMAAAALIHDLKDIARQEQDLLERTFRQAQELERREAPLWLGEEPPLHPSLRGPRRDFATPGDGSPEQLWGRNREGQRAQQSQRNGAGARSNLHPGLSGRGTSAARRRDPASSSMAQSAPVDALAGEQDGVRRRLGDVLQRMADLAGEIPQPFAQAEHSMRDATEALGAGMPGTATPHQGQAVEALRQGLRDFARDMAQKTGSPRRGGVRAQNGRGRDPLGRPKSSGMLPDHGEVRIPDQTELQKAREILDELRRRSGQAERPRFELDYINRLLKQFQGNRI